MPENHQHPAHRTPVLLMAVPMMFARGQAANMIVHAAKPAPDDQVVDIGCGPGVAVRLAARRCAGVTGVDPAGALLAMGRWLTAARRIPNVTFVKAGAEAMPLPDSSATIVWSVSAVHHWTDRTAGLAEAHRVLAPGGRVLLAERVVAPGSRGLAAHGLTDEQAEHLADDMAAAGFVDIHSEKVQTRRRRFTILSATVER